MGAAALAGTGFPIDREFISARLGFDGLLVHAYDAVSSRDDCLEAADAAKSVCLLIKRMTQDLLTWSTQEYGYIELSDQFADVSSIMPQKKNPGALSTIRALVGRVIGLSTEIASNISATPFEDEEDAITLITEPTYQVFETATAAIALLREIVNTLSPNRERMEHQAKIGFSTMTELADTIVRHTDLSFRDAHRLVGRVVLLTLSRGNNAQDITTEDVDLVAEEFLGRRLSIDENVIKDAIDPWQNILIRDHIGGPAPTEHKRFIEASKGKLAAFELEINDRQEQLERARLQTLAEIQNLAN
jgi:argininosuccinate lyase